MPEERDSTQDQENVPGWPRDIPDWPAFAVSYDSDRESKIWRIMHETFAEAGLRLSWEGVATVCCRMYVTPERVEEARALVLQVREAMGWTQESLYIPTVDPD